jgi:acetyl esterase/lipase
MKHLYLLSAFLLLFAIANAETELVPIKRAEVEVYKKASGDDLRIYRLDPADHDPNTDSRPAAVFFFGGGWNGGSVTQFEPHANYLAGRGMVVFLADYRVKSRQKTTPRECVADGKSAIRWVRKNAKRLGVDPDRIAAGGGSAGGHVAATTGMCDGFDEESEDAEISSRSEVLLLFNPVYNNGPEGYGNSRVKEWFPSISPAHSITKDDPPTIVFLGTKDKLIPVSQAEAFRDKQKKLGIDSELHLYEDEPHGFFNLKLGQGKAEHFKDTVLKMDAFLVKQSYLEGEADTALLGKIASSEKK